MLYDDSTAGQTYELNGPKEYSMGEIAEMVDREIFKKRRHVNVPRAVLKPAAGLLNRLLWWPTMSADEIEREFHDQQYDETAKGFKDLGIEPGDISKFTYHYLVRSARASRNTASRSSGLTAYTFTARIPEWQLLRPSTRHGEGEEGREEVSARGRRALSRLLQVFHLLRGRLSCRAAGLLAFRVSEREEDVKV